MLAIAEKILANITDSLNGQKDARIGERLLAELIKFDPTDPKKEVYNSAVITEIADAVANRKREYENALNEPGVKFTADEIDVIQKAIARDKNILDTLKPRLDHIAAKAEAARKSTADTAAEMDMHIDTKAEMDMQPGTNIGAATAAAPAATPSTARTV